MPTQLAGVHVLVDGSAAPLLYVGGNTQDSQQGQINFLVPSIEIPGAVTVQVVRQSIRGPAVTITLVEAAPALFPNAAYAIAQDGDKGANNATVTPYAPAQPGEMIVLYATGLGHTQPNPDPGEIVPTAATIVNLATLQVLLNGSAIDSSLIKYAGLTPASVGLYQINFLLPMTVPPNPEIRVAVAGTTSAPGLKLAVQATPSPASASIHETSLAGETLNR